MELLLNNPLLAIGLAMILAFADYPLTAMSRKQYYLYMFRYIDYESIAGQKKKPAAIWGIISKVLLGGALFGIWYMYSGSRLITIGKMYLWLLGFVIGTYLIEDLRHLESLLLARLYKSVKNVSGKLAYKPPFSMKISAIQLVSNFVVLGLLYIYSPDYFILGAVSASLFLVLRNLLLA
jgi:hypothetical protein